MKSLLEPIFLADNCHHNFNDRVFRGVKTVLL